MKRYIFAFLLFIFSANLQAQGVVYINETNASGNFDLSGNIFYLVDSSDQYTFDQVLNPDFGGKFIQSANSTFLYSNNVPSYWYKITIKNSSKQIKQLVLAINNPLISDITFFNTFDSTYYHTGLFYPFFQRQVIFKNYLFKVKIAPGQKGDICFKVNSQLQPEFLPITLMSENVTMKKLRINSFIDGVYYTILGFFIFTILILWFSEKEKIYIYLLGFVLFLSLAALWRGAYLFQYLWPNLPYLNVTVGKALSSFIIAFVLLFEFNVLKLNQAHKALTKLAISGIILSLLFGVLQLFLKSYVVYLFGIRSLLILLLTVTIAGIIHSRKLKIPYFKLYTFAIGLFVSDLIIRNFLIVETIGFGFYDTQLTTFISITFFIIITYIFISKFKNSRLEVIGLNKNLEYLVEKRTHELQSQKEELKSQHEELIQQKETLQNQREELRAKKELLELNNSELAKLSLVASKTDNLIYIFLPNGELDWFNASFSVMFKMTLEEYQRGNPLTIIDISSNNNIKHVLNTCLREKIVVSYESMKTDDNGEDRWYHTTLTPIVDDNNNIDFLIAIDTDITRLKHFENELNQQRKDAVHQTTLALNRKEELEERQTEITDSIRYAKRIQTGIMPKIKQIQRDFQDSFVLFLPKDIVSGDFYWYHRIGDKYFIAAVDCTGHGVPGAFMSIIGTNLLNSIIIYNGVTDAAEILKQLNRKIKIALKADSRSQTNDGMDISIAVIDKVEKKVEFASALRPVYLFSKGDFIEIKGDKIPISSSIAGTTISAFTKHSYPFNNGDMFYMFSDGIIDQFGGAKEKKFLTKRFKQLLFEINPLSMREQKDIIKKAFDDWKGNIEQVDDILVMGVRFKEDTASS